MSKRIRGDSRWTVQHISPVAEPLVTSLQPTSHVRSNPATIFKQIHDEMGGMSGRSALTKPTWYPLWSDPIKAALCHISIYWRKPNLQQQHDATITKRKTLGRAVLLQGLGRIQHARSAVLGAGYLDTWYNAEVTSTPLTCKQTRRLRLRQTSISTVTDTAIKRQTHL